MWKYFEKWKKGRIDFVPVDNKNYIASMVSQKKTFLELDLQTKGAHTYAHIQMKLFSDDTQLNSK